MNLNVCWMIFKFFFPMVVVVRPLALKESWVPFTGVVIHSFSIKRMCLGTPRPVFPMVPCFGFSSLFENRLSLPLACGFLRTP